MHLHQSFRDYHTSRAAPHNSSTAASHLVLAPCAFIVLPVIRLMGTTMSKVGRQVGCSSATGTRRGRTGDMLSSGELRTRGGTGAWRNQSGTTPLLSGLGRPAAPSPRPLPVPGGPSR